jgi:hypothetical protein
VLAHSLSWHISPNHDIDLSGNSIKNSDGTKSLKDSGGTKLLMVFVSTTEEWLNPKYAFTPWKFYCFDTDEWILDQYRRRVLWIPPDERPRMFWCF